MNVIVCQQLMRCSQHATLTLWPFKSPRCGHLKLHQAEKKSTVWKQKERELPYTIKLNFVYFENYFHIFSVDSPQHNRKLTIRGVYEPPKLQAADDTALYEETNSVTQSKETVTIGDFSCPNVDWNLKHGNQESNRLTEMVEDAFFTEIVDQPTGENNILDLVLVADPDLTRNCEVGDKLSSYVHHLVRFNAKTEYNLTDNI